MPPKKREKVVKPEDHGAITTQQLLQLADDLPEIKVFQISSDQILSCWHAFCLQVGKAMRHRKAVMVPSMGEITEIRRMHMDKRSSRLYPQCLILDSSKSIGKGKKAARKAKLAQIDEPPRSEYSHLLFTAGKGPIVQPNFKLLASVVGLPRHVVVNIIEALFRELMHHIMAGHKLRIEFPSLGLLQTNDEGYMRFRFCVDVYSYFNVQNHILAGATSASGSSKQHDADSEDDEALDLDDLRKQMAMMSEASVVAAYKDLEKPRAPGFVMQEVLTKGTVPAVTLFSLCQSADRLMTACVPVIQMQHWLAQPEFESLVERIPGNELVALMRRHVFDDKTGEFLLYPAFLDELHRLNVAPGAPPASEDVGVRGPPEAIQASPQPFRKPGKDGMAIPQLLEREGFGLAAKGVGGAGFAPPRGVSRLPSGSGKHIGGRRMPEGIPPNKWGGPHISDPPPSTQMEAWAPDLPWQSGPSQDRQPNLARPDRVAGLKARSSTVFATHQLRRPLPPAPSPQPWSEDPPWSDEPDVRPRGPLPTTAHGGAEVTGEPRPQTAAGPAESGQPSYFMQRRYRSLNRKECDAWNSFHFDRLAASRASRKAGAHDRVAPKIGQETLTVEEAEATLKNGVPPLNLLKPTRTRPATAWLTPTEHPSPFNVLDGSVVF